MVLQPQWRVLSGDIHIRSTPIETNKQGENALTNLLASEA